ncbi:hypothetical protein AB0467_20880 [Streptomyces sp. NPDC052095]|uniref:hypothetical protein n=1 Tax=unclassified Streptomyces TaxID=2593676 RepID=UPI00344F07F6
MPQVAGSAVAAVAAAVAASQLGVYGTILGAGVMSIVATCGGSVFQHLFRRTGEQIRDVTVQARGAGGGGTGRTPGHGPRAPYGTGAADATAVLPAADDPDRTRMLRAPDATQLLTAAHPVPDGEFSEATTHGTRLRGWKRSALGAAVVFVLAMAGITTYELVSGGDLSGGHGTTVGSVVRGGGERGSGTDVPAPSTSTGRDGAPDRESGTTPGTEQQGGASRTPDPAQSGRPSTGPTADPAPSGSTGGTDPAPETTPSPGASGGGSTTDPAAPAAGDAPAQGDGTGTGAGQ